MRSGWLFLILAPLLPANPEIVLQTTRVSHVPVVHDVFLNGIGPFRMMIDTGHAGSSVRPRVSEQLRLRPAYTVDHVTATGTRRVPAAVLQEVRIGTAVTRTVEVMITSVLLPGIDGILGQSWLIHHDYQLDYAGNRLVLNSTPPDEGIRIALRSVDGRPAISAMVDGRRSDVVLDSGAPAVIVFESSLRIRPVSLGSLSTVRLAVGGHSFRMDAVRVPTPDPAPPLLPLMEFRSVFISNRDGIVVLVR
jgi:predicted aspartyl protease